MSWITPYELAKIKNVKRQTIYNWIREGKIPKENVRKVKKVVYRLEVKIE